MTNTTKVSDIAAAMNLLLAMRDREEGLRVFGLDTHWAAVLDELVSIEWVEIVPGAKAYAFMTPVGRDALDAALASGMETLSYRTTWV